MQIQKIKQFFKKWSYTENSNTFLTFFITFSFLFLALISVEGVFLSFVPNDNSLYPLQVFETNLVYEIQRAFKVDVMVINETILYYKTLNPPLNLVIVSACTGLHEMIFLSTLILAFRGVSFKSKLKWLGIFIPFLFIENLIRIATSQPLIAMFGFETWDNFHYIFWNFGQLIVVMVLFFLWFLFVASKEINKDKVEKITAEKKDEKTKEISKTEINKEKLSENKSAIKINKTDIEKIDLTEKEKKNLTTIIFISGLLMFLWAYILSELMKVQFYDLHLITLFSIIGFYLGRELL